MRVALVFLTGCAAAPRAEPAPEVLRACYSVAERGETVGKECVESRRTSRRLVVEGELRVDRPTSEVDHYVAELDPKERVPLSYRLETTLEGTTQRIEGALGEGGFRVQIDTILGKAERTIPLGRNTILDGPSPLIALFLLRDALADLSQPISFRAISFAYPVPAPNVQVLGFAPRGDDPRGKKIAETTLEGEVLGAWLDPLGLPARVRSLGGGRRLVYERE